MTFQGINIEMTPFMKLIPTRKGMKDTRNGRKPVQGWLPEDLHQRVTRTLKKNGQTKQDLIEAACRKYVEEGKRK